LKLFQRDRKAVDTRPERWESAGARLLPCRTVADGAYYHLIYPFAMAFCCCTKICAKPLGRDPLHILIGCTQDDKSAEALHLPTLATMRRDVLLQAGNGHGHMVRQAPFLFPCQLAPTDQTSHAVTGFLELTFEPSMLWTTNRMGRKGAHPAPVENVAGEVTKKANKRQTLFSPIVRHWLVPPSALRNAAFSEGSA
jgi:hypothetical protein